MYMMIHIQCLRLLGLYESPDNAFGANAIMEVLINEHLLKDSAGI